MHVLKFYDYTFCLNILSQLHTLKFNMQVINHKSYHLIWRKSYDPPVMVVIALAGISELPGLVAVGS